MTQKLTFPAFLYFGIFLVVFFISFYLKLFPVLNNNFPFTMDQARDMLDIRAIVELKKPTLIGPTTSINGVFLGPFYYYFNLPPFILSSGDPASLTYWNIFWYMTASVVLLLFFYKKDKTFGLISSLIFLMAPAFFYSSRYFWSANPMPYMTLFYFLSIFNFFRKPVWINSALTGLIAGLSMQVEAAFGVLFFPFFFIDLLLRRSGWRNIFASLGAFFITIAPQLIFELRHDFIMTKTFLGEIGGQSQILGERFAFAQTFQNHFQTFVQFSSEQFQFTYPIPQILLLISLVYLGFLVFKKKLKGEPKNIYLISVFFVLFAFFFYLFYPYPLKGWYLLGLRVPYILIIALFLTEIFKKNFIFKTLVILILVLSFVLTFLDQSKFIPKTIADRSTDKSTLRNEIEVIDWVYAKSSGKGFKAYNYIPSVYDYPYQYLYWWHGGKQYGYHPEVLTYLDNVPEYIKDNERFLTLKKPQEDNLIFLIYEPDSENQERLHAWLGNFTKFCEIQKQTFEYGTTAEMRQPCP